MVTNTSDIREIVIGTHCWLPAVLGRERSERPRQRDEMTIALAIGAKGWILRSSAR
jgi:hypothetical protein